VVFPRELSYFSGSRTQPVVTGYFSTGEVILDSDSYSDSLYAIEKGECEIVYRGKVVSVMASDELFSTAMLKTYGDQDVQLRARTDVELITIADDLLTQISGVLKPVQEILNRSTSPQVDIWQHLPEAKSALDNNSVADLMRPKPEICLYPEDSVARAFDVLRKSGERLALVYTKGQEELCGIVTRTNLFSKLDQGAGASVGECMVKNPTAVTRDDPVMVAINTMRDTGIKSVPVLENQFQRNVVGLLHTDDIIARVMAIPGGPG
jgi:signal-transduction protein with cAMP-binding, CBS, and nucleotidyltransferase domain